MVDSGLLEMYLNEKTAKEGDICVITADGIIEDKVDPTSKRKYKLLNLPVECNGRALIYSPNKDALNVFRVAFGMDSENWVGKKWSVKLYPKSSFGKPGIAILPVILDVKVK